VRFNLTDVVPRSNYSARERPRGRYHERPRYQNSLRRYQKLRVNAVDDYDWIEKAPFGRSKGERDMTSAFDAPTRAVA
jgi:hypothetical protein